VATIAGQTQMPRFSPLHSPRPGGLSPPRFQQPQPSVLPLRAEIVQKAPGPRGLEVPSQSSRDSVGIVAGTPNSAIPTLKAVSQPASGRLSTKELNPITPRPIVNAFNVGPSRQGTRNGLSAATTPRQSTPVRSRQSQVSSLRQSTPTQDRMRTNIRAANASPAVQSPRTAVRAAVLVASNTGTAAAEKNAMPSATLGACGNPACNKDGTNLCSTCGTKAYCSVSCQQSHWKTHKPDCKKSMPVSTPVPPAKGVWR